MGDILGIEQHSISPVSRLRDVALAVGGGISVTNFGADPSGVLDSTSAFLRAIAYATQYNMPLVVPPGSYRVTETFDFGTLQVTAFNATLSSGQVIPAVSYPAGTALTLGDLTIDTAGNLTTPGALTLGGAITKVGGYTTVGLGAPAIIAYGHVLVTGLTATTIVSFTTGASAHQYALLASVFVNNGTSGNDITFGLSAPYAMDFTGTSGATPVVFSGANSVANGNWACPMMLIPTSTSTTYTVSYTDPTNTPNDSVACLVLQLT